MRGLLAAVVVAAATLLPGAAAGARVAPLAISEGLSDSGRQAIADLRTCLESRDVLNVYYVIDSSLSLAVADGQGAGSGSDPDVLRASILANSLEQLGRLGDDDTVNWAAGFFSTEFSSAIPWRTWQEGGSAELDAAIRSRTPSGYTNWPAALRGAQGELAQQQSEQPGCQLLVWLTDGQLDIRAPNGPGPEDRDALNEMCGATLDPAGAAPTGYGIFNSFRQSGVVVVGALLATTDAASRAGQVMRPLIEGADPDTGVACGQQPMPEGHVHGAFVEATSPDALAHVFLQLAAQVGGGYPHPFDADGSFWIDPGVARFRIIVGGDWTLHPPAESGLGAASPGAAQPWVTPGTDAGVIEVSTTDAAAQGRWRLEAGDTRSLYLFSDLSIVFEPTNRIELGADGATAATLLAQVRGADGEDADLADFAPGTFSARLVGADGTRTPLPGARVDAATGAISIPVPSDVTAAEVVVEASIDPLTTSRHGLELAPVTTQQSVKTVLPTDYPRIATIPVRLGTLEGRDGVATGTITVSGPATGDAGQVCLRGDPDVTSDSASRDATWRWTVGGELDTDGCIAVPVGGEVEIPISAANEEAADSAVRASIPVGLRSATGPELTQDVPIAFTSTHPVNVAAIGLIALVLLVLSVLLPLLVLWLINWLTTRLDIDRSIQRASFAARITPGGVVFTDAPTSDTALSERFRYRGEARNVRTLDDPDLGRIRTIVPWFPLRAPKYGIAPTGDRVVVAARTGARVASAGERRPDGSMLFAQLPFDAFWAVVVSRAELRRTKRGDEVAATAVVYHRESSDPAQYRDRLADISRDAAVADTVERVRVVLAERDAAQAKPGTDAGRPPAGEPPAGSPASSAPPLASASQPRSGSTPPPLPGSRPAPGGSPAGPPPRPSAAPPRPGGAPPGAAGGPPPRPGGR
ncbi:hypothetical protein GCM10009739_20870 [Microbacterium ulmi]